MWEILAFRYFRPYRLVVVVPPGHTLSGRERIAFADTLNEEFVGLAGDSALQQHLIGHAGRAGGRMRRRARVRGLDIVCRMVALGAGIAVVPEAVGRRWSHGGALGIVRLEDQLAERELLVIVKRLAAVSAHARRLVEHLTARV